MVNKGRDQYSMIEWQRLFERTKKEEKCWSQWRYRMVLQLLSIIIYKYIYNQGKIHDTQNNLDKSLSS